MRVKTDVFCNRDRDGGKKEGEKERKEEGKEQEMRCSKHVEVMQSQ